MRDNSLVAIVVVVVANVEPNCKRVDRSRTSNSQFSRNVQVVVFVLAAFKELFGASIYRCWIVLCSLNVLCLPSSLLKDPSTNFGPLKVSISTCSLHCLSLFKLKSEWNWEVGSCNYAMIAAAKKAKLADNNINSDDDQVEEKASKLVESHQHCSSIVSPLLSWSLSCSIGFHQHRS